MSGWVFDNGTVVEVVQPQAVVATLVALPAGSGSGGFSGFEHNQSSASALWTIALPTDFPIRRPAVEIYVGNVEVEADISWLPSTRTITIEFPTPVTGVAVLT